MPDVAVGVDTPDGYRLVSWFEALTDSTFDAHRQRGLASRTRAIISRAQRDADPLTCDGQTFTGSGSLANWVDF